MKTWIFASFGLALALLAGGGCSSDAGLGGNGPNACDGQNWRQSTPNAVVCPGTPDCACPAGQACCLNGNAPNQTGTCGDVSQCGDWALTCDGPEDCPSGQVCCLHGKLAGGSECRDPKDCFFNDEIPLCRQASDCDGLDECTPSQPGTSFEGIIAGCVLN